MNAYLPSRRPLSVRPSLSGKLCVGSNEEDPREPLPPVDYLLVPEWARTRTSRPDGPLGKLSRRRFGGRDGSVCSATVVLLSRGSSIFRYPLIFIFRVSVSRFLWIVRT